MKRTLLAILAVLCLALAAQAQSNPGLQWMRGTYYVSYTGYLVIPSSDPANPFGTPVPGIISGILSIDASGNISGTAYVSLAGAVVEYESRGTVTMKTDISGTMNIESRVAGTDGDWGTNEVDKFVVLRDEKEIHTVMISTAEGALPVGPAVLGKWKKLSPIPNSVTW
jgi:hypothetical protein